MERGKKEEKVKERRWAEVICRGCGPLVWPECCWSCLGGGAWRCIEQMGTYSFETEWWLGPSPARSVISTSLPGIAPQRCSFCGLLEAAEHVSRCFDLVVTLQQTLLGCTKLWWVIITSQINRMVGQNFYLPMFCHPTLALKKQPRVVKPWQVAESTKGNI